MHLIVLYSMSRYDLAQSPPIPFSGSAGAMFKHRTLDLLPPGTTYDIQRIDMPCNSGRLQHDTRYLALGRYALKFIQPVDDDLNKNRGLVLTYNGCPAIATYSPIDCWDFKHQDDDEDEDDDKEDAKDVGPTSRANFLHWAIRDIRKLVSLPWPLPADCSIPPFIAPPAEHVVQWLHRVHDYAIIDIETRRQDHSLDCIGFRANGTALVVPFYRHNSELFYSLPETARIYRAVAHLLSRQDVVIVGHNLGFDLAVLGLKYNLPIPPRVYDTMLAMHRELPQLEKSLSHALSEYTFAQRNHKADIAANVSWANFQRLLAYNANDVLWTEKIYLEQLRRAQSDSALADAIDIANRTLRTTLMISLTGTRIDLFERERQIQRSQFRAAQLTRVIRLLTNEPEFNPNSSKQIAAYFYDKLKYPCDTFTETGARAADSKTLYKLQTKQPNPLIPLIIAAKEEDKAHSALEFRLRQSKV